MWKKYFFSLLVLLAITCFLPLSASWAQEMNETINSDITGRWGLGARYGYVDKENQNIRHEGTASIIFGLSEFTALELEGGLLGDRDMEKEIYSGFVDLLFRIPINNFAPYLRGGLGAQNHKFRDLDDWDDSFSQRVGGGIEYFFNRNLAINGEIIYVWGGDNTFNAPYYRAGIKCYF